MADARLTPQQQAVVENRGGTLLVSAAAGSGKTKVLVDRVLKRIVDEGNNINEFLIITFTNAAAAELRGKISRALSQALAEQPENRHLARQLELLHLAQISTVHAFCGALIRQYGYLLEVPPDCGMLEDSQTAELLDRLVKELLEEAYQAKSPGFCQLTDTLGAGRSDGALVQLILDVREKIQNQPDPEKWLRGRQLYFSESEDLTRTPWGQILIENAKKQLDWQIARYDWAIGEIERDELLAPKYLSSFQVQRQCYVNMRAAMDRPWDEIGPALKLEVPKYIAPKNYPDKQLLENLKKRVRAYGEEKVLKPLQKQFGRPASELIAEQNCMAPALEALAGLVLRLDAAFSREKRRRKLLDYSDQEHLAMRLLRDPETERPTEVAREVSKRFAEIMVDEYQDSNRIQESIFTAICTPGDTNRFLVGDVKQSIYGFRQAEPGLFLKKYEDYAPAEQAQEGQSRKLVLPHNFRSRPEILEAVNHVFSAVMSKDVGGISYDAEARLYEGLAEYPETDRTHVELYVLRSKTGEEPNSNKYRQEARWMANRINRLLADKTPIRDENGLRPVRPEDIAILFRTKGPIATFSRELRRAGIPVASAGSEALFEAPEVRVLVDLLKVLNNPHQDIPLLAVLCSPLFRFSNDRLAKIRSGSRAERFYDAMRESREDWCVSALTKLEALRQRAGELSADVLVWELLEHTGLLDTYSAMENGAFRRENLLAVYELSRKAAGGGYLYLYELIRALDRAAENGMPAAAQSTEGVVLSSMHGAKGLEYPVVFLADLAHGFNKTDQQEQVQIDSELGIGAKITDPENRVRYPGLCSQALAVKQQQTLLSEEMRILYVAMTRAKDYLFMTYTEKAPESALARLQLGAGYPAAAWASAGAKCPGDWILLSALSRIEAGELFSLCGRPETELLVSDFPWGIFAEDLEEGDPPEAHWRAEQQKTAVQVPSPAQLAERLLWQDPHAAAAKTPSKLTATQLKGRDKDQEAAEGARVKARIPSLQRPEFILEKRGLSATERGTATHLFLQYADFSACKDLDGVTAELDRLCEQEFLTQQQADAVAPETIAALFASPLGKRMLAAERLIREFKFSILEDASNYYADVEGEQVLLQGVVDAAIWEEDGLTVIDFKTDRVTEATVRERAEEYRGQLMTYKRALERIFEKPVKETVLYFLTIGTEVAL